MSPFGLARSSPVLPPLRGELPRRLYPTARAVGSIRATLRGEVRSGAFTAAPTRISRPIGASVKTTPRALGCISAERQHPRRQKPTVQTFLPRLRGLPLDYPQEFARGEPVVTRAITVAALVLTCGFATPTPA